MMMNKETLELEQIYYLDLGSSAPVAVKTKEFTEKGVLCEYLFSWAGRTEILSYELFHMNGYEVDMRLISLSNEAFKGTKPLEGVVLQSLKEVLIKQISSIPTVLPK